ncbi:23560_t:CDS:2, partial [Racocetra persica]
AGDVLTSVWENTIIDSYLVLVKYIDLSEKYHYPNKKLALWIEKHVMTCRYMTQVTKCDDQSCCKPFRTNINASDDTIHYFGFLLSVLMEGKLIPPNMNLRRFPFNWYCPTINKSINEYICPYCNKYFALKKTLNYYTRKYSYKESNLSVEPSLDVQDFQVDTNASIHNYRHGEVLVSNQSKDAMWVEKET